MLAATMKTITSKLMRPLTSVKNVIQDRTGNFGIMFALLAVPLAVAVGASLDFARAYNMQLQLQTDLDSALLYAAKDMGNQDESALRAAVLKWFKAQDSYTKVVSMKDTDVQINKVTNQITATMQARISTTILSITGKKTIDVKASSTVQGASDTYYEIHIILDKSASMLLAATTADQTIMKKLSLNCVFACHDTVYAEKYNGVNYTSYYDYARKNGVKLRADVQADAVKTMMDTVDVADPTHKRIKIALYTLGTDTNGSNLTSTKYDVKNGMRQVRSPTYDTNQVRTDLTNNTNLTSATSYLSTDYRALTTMMNYMTTNGDGKSANSPYKLVVMITDGVQSSDYWVFYNQNQITPLNPVWCDTIKNQKISMAVLYTEYLPWTNRNEYNNSVGNTMASSAYKTLWGGTMPSPSTVSRHDYIPTSLKTCASSSDYFIMASSPTEISTGLTKIVGNYLGKVRLTN